MSETWGVISFWVRLWTFCWLVIGRFAGIMLGKLVRQAPYTFMWKRRQ